MTAPVSSADRPLRSDSRRRRVPETFSVFFLLATAVRSGAALCGEAIILPGAPIVADFNDSRAYRVVAPPVLSLPPSYEVTEFPRVAVFSPRDFRPRGHSMIEKESDPAAQDAVPMLVNTTVWQRLSEFRTHNRVRLLTLWEAGGSSLSLQAGRRGDPSLQWTSRLMNRGGATRGVFDQVVSASLWGTGHGMHTAPRGPAVPDVPGKPSKLAESAVTK